MKKILIVDDNPGARGLMLFALEHGGYRVETAEDGIAGLEAIAWFKPELVLLNLMMPRMDGFTMLATLRQNPPPTMPRVVITTGHMGDEMVERAFLAGAMDILFYPVNLKLLSRVVQEVLEPEIDSAERMIGAKVRHAMDAVKYGGCSMGIEATRRLPLAKLSPMQRRDLRGSLLEAVQKDAKRPTNPKRSVATWGKFGPEIEPALIATALALAL
jgi:CheY-like chemotaxis protein